MEVFGRIIAVIISVPGVIFLLVFHKTASVQWQKNETVRSMSNAYAESVLRNRRISCASWDAFRKELMDLGEYQAEIFVYERRRFEGDNGRVYLYKEWDVGEGERVLSEGSYVRLVIMEQGKGQLQTFLYGSECVIIAGGRVT